MKTVFKDGVEMVEIVTPYRRDPRTGKILFPKNSKVFRFFIPIEKHRAYIKRKKDKNKKRSF